MAITAVPRSTDKRIKPIEKSGIKTMSLGFPRRCRDADDLARSMVTGAHQLMMDVDWAPLDVLVVDMRRARATRR